MQGESSTDVVDYRDLATEMRMQFSSRMSSNLSHRRNRWIVFSFDSFWLTKHNQTIFPLRNLVDGV
jgi:hypothetical protein